MLFQSLDKKFHVSLSDSVIAQIKYYAKISGDYETGGIIIGSYNTQLDTATVTLISGPPSDSKFGRTWFMRGTKGLKQLLAKCHKNAGTYYIGEWHFHPFASPTPSGQDIRQMKDIAVDRKYNCPEPVMIIIGGNPHEPVNILKAFIFEQRGRYQELVLATGSSIINDAPIEA